MRALPLSRHSRIAAGILLLSLLAVEFGGTYLIRITTGDVPQTEFQQAFARAGHGHAGMLVTLGLVGLLYADAAKLTGVVGVVGRHCVPVGALLMSGGFFFSAIGAGTTEPNGWFVLVWIGGISLGIGLLTLAISLLAGARGTGDAADEPLRVPAPTSQR